VGAAATIGGRRWWFAASTADQENAPEIVEREVLVAVDLKHQRHAGFIATGEEGLWSTIGS
jgi:hypothetical protein